MGDASLGSLSSEMALRLVPEAWKQGYSGEERLNHSSLPSPRRDIGLIPL